MRTGVWFDPYTDNPADSVKQWLNTHFWRMETTPGYFDSRLSWYPNAWAYIDLYGVPTSSSLASQHPDWFLHDNYGNIMYIPFACNNGSCSQYAGDPGSAGFRNWWISQAQGFVSRGYKGLWIDDVNGAFRVGNGYGTQMAPYDPRTGTTMTLDNWMQYIADFTKAIRQALPNTELVHNSIWFANNSEGQRWNSPQIVEEIQQADYIDCERGVSDSGLTGDGGYWSVQSFFQFVDQVHALGKSVVFDEYALNGEYGLAGYFMINSGTDAEGDQSMTPNNWWSGYNVNLGNAQDGRYTWNGLLRRDFSGGMVLMNLPHAGTVTVTLPQYYTRIDGSLVNSVTLAGGQGAVLIGSTNTASGVSAVTQIDTGSTSSAGSFSYDNSYYGGLPAYTAGSIDLSGVSNPAPMAVYQTERWGASNYTLGGYTPGAQYTVRLHFAEFYWYYPGQRVFSVAINGSTVLSNFDIIAAAGSRMKAVSEQFTTTANSNGQIDIQFLQGPADWPKVSGIEILQ